MNIWLPIAGCVSAWRWGAIRDRLPRQVSAGGRRDGGGGGGGGGGNCGGGGGGRQGIGRKGIGGGEAAGGMAVAEERKRQGSVEIQYWGGGVLEGGVLGGGDWRGRRGTLPPLLKDHIIPKRRTKDLASVCKRSMQDIFSVILVESPKYIREAKVRRQ